MISAGYAAPNPFATPLPASNSGSPSTIAAVSRLTKADIARAEARIDQVAAALTWRMTIAAAVVQALDISPLLQSLRAIAF